jgi:hypothetical protein
MNSMIECLISQRDKWINEKLINEDGLRLKAYGNPSKPPLIPLSCGIISPHYSSPYPSTTDGVFHFIIFNVQCLHITSLGP